MNRGRYANDGSEQSNSIANIHATLPLCQCWKFSLLLYGRISYIPDILSTSTLAILCYQQEEQTVEPEGQGFFLARASRHDAIMNLL